MIILTVFLSKQLILILLGQIWRKRCIWTLRQIIHNFSINQAIQYRQGCCSFVLRWSYEMTNWTHPKKCCSLENRRQKNDKGHILKVWSYEIWQLFPTRTCQNSEITKCLKEKGKITVHIKERVSFDFFSNQKKIELKYKRQDKQYTLLKRF